MTRHGMAGRCQGASSIARPCIYMIAKGERCAGGTEVLDCCRNERSRS
jgi:hypothetical protein